MPILWRFARQRGAARLCASNDQRGQALILGRFLRRDARKAAAARGAAFSAYCVRHHEL